jgi:hypothetical protein
MENDIRNENNENLVDMNDYFQLDFAKEDLKGNRKFEEFKKQRLDELGKDAKLFHCKNDNIYFYVNKKECEIDDENNICYFKRCHLCKNYICYFCERIRQNPKEDKMYRKYCCVLLNLYYLFFIKGFKYCKDYSQLDYNEKSEFKLYLKYTLIPLIKCFWYSIRFFSLLFDDLLLKDKKLKKQINNDLTYQNYLDDGKYIFIAFCVVVNGITNIICYTIIFYIFDILILIVSLFTKFNPLKYSVGIYRGLFDY